MCTIGVVFNRNGHAYAFKNLDEKREVITPEPEIVEGPKYRYIKFGIDRRAAHDGVWAGVNEKGLILFGADAYATLHYSGPDYGGHKELQEAYLGSLGECESVHQAAGYTIESMQRQKIGINGDIIMFIERRNAVVLEYVLNRWGLEYAGQRDYIVRSNFFQVIPQFRPPREERTLYLSSSRRYETAMNRLSRKSDETTMEGIRDLVSDHELGPSAFSICRHGGNHEYKTQASCLIDLSEEKAVATYITNDSPCKGRWKTIELELTK